MSVITNTTWDIHANNFDGNLTFTEDNAGAVTGTVFGQPLESIQLVGNSITFVRRISIDYVQLYSGTVMNAGLGGIDASWSMMGLFTEKKGAAISMPYLWSTNPLLIPG